MIEKSLKNRKKRNRTFTNVLRISALILSAPLFILILEIILRGIFAFFGNYSGELTKAAEGGGILRATLSALAISLASAAFSIPVSLLSAGFLSLDDYKTARAIFRVLLDLSSGIPPVVAGLAVFAAAARFGLAIGWLAAAAALAILLIPRLSLSFEKNLRNLDPETKLAAKSLGAGAGRMFFFVTIPSSLKGLIKTAARSTARVFGSAAPVLFLAFVLPTLVYDYSGLKGLTDAAWAGALILSLALFGADLLFEGETREANRVNE